MAPRSAWLTREDLKKLPKIPKIRCDAKTAPTSATVLETEPKFTTSTPATLVPMTPPLCPFELEQRLNSSGSEITKTPCASPSAIQMETGMTITPQCPFFPQRSTGPTSTQATPTNGPFCSESSQVLSLPITPPLTPTGDFDSSLESAVPSSTKSSTKIQEADRLDSGARSTRQSEVKETKESLGRSQNTTSDLRGTSPLKDARTISSQVQKSSPLSCTVTGANGKTTHRVANSLPTSTQHTRSSKEFNMDFYNSCDCRSDGGQECIYCRILKGAFEFCKRVDHAMKER